VASPPFSTSLVAGAGTANHTWVASKSYDFRLGVLACFGTLSFKLWLCILQLHTVLTGIVNGRFQLWALLATSTPFMIT
jgi:hypothetical protein